VRLAIAMHYDLWIAELDHHLARFALAAIEGALLLAKVQQSPEALIEVGEVLSVLMTTHG
jgi:hypothetical protein